MKKVLIFYASYGGGHLSAARSIKEYIDENYTNIDSELIDCIKYINKTVDKVTTTAYKEIVKKAPWAWGKIYDNSQKGSMAHISTGTNKVMAIKLDKLIQDKKPDLIISTHPFGTQMSSYLKKKSKTNAKISTILTDFAPHDQWLVGSEYVDYFFVAHDRMKDYLVEKNIAKEKIYPTGIPLSNRFLLNYNKKEILESFGLKEGKRTILFFGGGEFGLGKSKTLELFKTFTKDIDDIQIVAISGKNPKMKKGFEELVSTEKKEDIIKILDYTNKIPELMSVSDLVVTKPGGLTTTESLASGLPIIFINPIPGQEEENAQFLTEKEVGIWLKNSDDTKKIITELFNDPERMRKMKINARLMAKKTSTKDICDILLK